MSQKICEILKILFSMTIAIFISLAFTIGVLMVLSKDKDIEKKDVSLVKVKEEKQLDYNEILFEQEKKLNCLKNTEVKNKVECFKSSNKEEINPVVNEVKKNYIPTKLEQAFLKLNSRDAFIFLSYVLIMLLIGIQTFVFLTVLVQNKNSSTYKFIQKYKFTLGELCLNAPMTIGLLGSIYAYAIGMDSSTTSGIIEAFKKIIFDGVGTTLLGGLTYVYSLSLNIYIQK